MWTLGCSMGSLSCSMWDLVPQPGIEPGPPALEAWSLSHWITSKVPKKVHLRRWHISWDHEWWEGAPSGVGRLILSSAQDEKVRRESGISLMVQFLGLCAFNCQVQVQSPVRELRSWKLRGVATKNEQRSQAGVREGVLELHEEGKPCGEIQLEAVSKVQIRRACVVVKCTFARMPPVALPVV